MRLCKKSKEYKEICNNIRLSKYSGRNKLIKIFEYLYLNKNFILLKIYYFMRNVIKKIKV